MAGLSHPTDPKRSILAAEAHTANRRLIPGVTAVPVTGTSLGQFRVGTGSDPGRFQSDAGSIQGRDLSSHAPAPGQYRASPGPGPGSARHWRRSRSISSLCQLIGLQTLVVHPADTFGSSGSQAFNARNISFIRLTKPALSSSWPPSASSAWSSRSRAQSANLSSSCSLSIRSRIG